MGRNGIISRAWAMNKSMEPMRDHYAWKQHCEPIRLGAKGIIGVFLSLSPGNGKLL
jgi:hypothetical protein